MILALVLFLFAISPDGTTAPPASEIVDLMGNVWALKGGLPNPECDPVAEVCLLDTVLLLYCQGQVYAQHRTTGAWYRGAVGRGWTLVGISRPC